MCEVKLDDGIEGRSGYSTLVVGVPGHEDIATHPPVGSPAETILNMTLSISIV